MCPSPQIWYIYLVMEGVYIKSHVEIQVKIISCKNTRIISCENTSEVFYAMQYDNFNLR